MRWESLAVVLGTRPFGEKDAIAVAFSAEYGVYRGFVRGGSGRRRAALWERGNLLSVQWAARLAEQLGSFSGELVRAIAALAMDDPLELTMLEAITALAEGALPERVPEPALFAHMVRLMTHLEEGDAMLPEFVRWESHLLSALGYGLDLSVVDDRIGEEALFVSPRTGRAVSEAAAGKWRDRLYPLPRFLFMDAPSGPPEWRDGLKLTGHFLARSVFGARDRPLPEARLRLYDRVAMMAKARES